MLDLGAAAVLLRSLPALSFYIARQLAFRYIVRLRSEVGGAGGFACQPAPGPRPKRDSERILFDRVDDSLILSALAYPAILGFISTQ